MCGIVGYIGGKEAYPILIKGLGRLEYRGYDSAGMALLNGEGTLNVYKTKGKVADLDAFCKDEHFSRYLPEYANLGEMKAHYERGGLGDMKVKKFLNAVMQETLEPIRTRREALEKDIPAVWEILYKGSVEAKQVAAETLAKVKSAMKIDYFADREGR